MATGATGQLGLALPVQGELSGTWGDTVNNGITQYTNIAIAATLTLTNDGAVTLANTTGDASASNIVSTLTGAGTVTAQFAIVRVTGTLTTAKVVTAPSYSKTYVVVNAATGGIVTFKASGQTGVSIAVGESAWVYYNGTDYVKIAGTTSGSAGGSTTQVQYNSSGSLAGSSNLTFDGTSLTLGGNPTLSAGTANGVTYLNGSKVLTSGSALTYNGTDLQFASGSGLFTNTSDGSDTATLAIGGGGANSTARGSVIELYGNENATAGVLDMTSGNVANSYVRIQGRSSTSYVRFDINASERARIDSSGNLLVGGTAARGTTAGTAHLDLFDGTAPAGTLTNGISLYSSSGDLKFMNAAGTAFDVGYRNIPQNAQTGSYTMVLADAGNHIYHASGAGAATYTIPAASSVAYPIGTAITFINLSATSISIAITTDTMYLSSAGTTGTRTLAQYGSATAIKVSGLSSSGIWVISGSGLT